MVFTLFISHLLVSKLGYKIVFHKEAFVKKGNDMVPWRDEGTFILEALMDQWFMLTTCSIKERYQPHDRKLEVEFEKF